MCRGAFTLTVTTLCVLLLAAGTAAAATPQQIYRDLADNGQLDRKYSQADVNRALRNPSIPGYARERPVRKPQSRHVPVGAPTGTEAHPLPFTGLDLALFGAVGAPLLLIAGSMRHFVRAKVTES